MKAPLDRERRSRKGQEGRNHWGGRCQRKPDSLPYRLSREIEVRRFASVPFPEVLHPEVTVADDSNSKTGSDKRKQSLYFPEIMLQEIKDEAARLDRSLSWVVQRAWKLARTEIRKIPSVNDVDDEDEASA